MNQDITPLEQAGNTYFSPRSDEEMMPVEVDETTNFKYFGLEKFTIFTTLITVYHSQRNPQRTKGKKKNLMTVRSSMVKLYVIFYK